MSGSVSLPPPVIGRLAGLAAIASAAASIAWLAGVRPADGFPDRWIAAWNVLLIPAAIWLGMVLGAAKPGHHRSGRRPIAAIAGTAGVASCLTWASSYARPGLEWVWIGLSAVWWLGTGWLLLGRGRRALGSLTLVLGAFATLDAIVTVLGDEGPAFLLASPKLPLGWGWALAIGLVLLIDPLLDPRRR